MITTYYSSNQRPQTNLLNIFASSGRPSDIRQSDLVVLLDSLSVGGKVNGVFIPESTQVPGTFDNMPSATGQSWEKYKKEFADEEEPEKKITPLTDESGIPGRRLQSVINLCRDIQVLKTYGAAPYAAALKKLEKQIKEKQTSVNEKIGVKVATFRATP